MENGINAIPQPQRRWKFFVFFTLCLLVLPTISRSVDSSLLEPYIEKHANGWIDWQNGLVYGVGRGYLDQNRTWPRAQGAASVVASGNILKLAAGLHLDDKNTLETLGRGKVVVQLKAFMRDRQHENKTVEDVARPYCEVVRVASIKGIDGLTAKLLSYLQTSTPEWRDFPIPKRQPQLTDESQPWLVLDARELEGADQAKPALFPKITSESGEVIHNVKNADEAALINRGMMQYVVSSASKQNLRSEKNSLEHILAAAGYYLSPIEAQAADGKRQKRGQFIVKDVQATQGLAKTNLVISDKDAQQLKAEDHSSQILKNCRVIVVVSSPIGGIEGKRQQYLASASGI